jgi:tRNA (adenine57-N1/adenine58-N1)-methyltransferase
LYTFDFHEHRASIANIEFEKHGLNDFVTLKVKDICIEGFGEDLKCKVDAIFLDLPHPWLTIEHATAVLKETGNSFILINVVYLKYQYNSNT